MTAETQTLVVGILELLRDDTTARMAMKDAAERRAPANVRDDLIALCALGPTRTYKGETTDELVALIADVSNDTPE